MDDIILDETAGFLFKRAGVDGVLAHFARSAVARRTLQ